MNPIMIFLPSLLIIGGVWAFFLEPNLICEEVIEVGLQKVSDQARALKIVQISDLHYQQTGLRERKLIRKLERIGPDYIFITGDLVDWTTKDLDGARSFFEKISKISPKKVFSVQGNHEHRHPKSLEVKKVIKQVGITILRNESVRLEEDIYLLGVDDPHWDFDDLNQAFRGVDLDAPKILLSHSPEVFRKVNDSNILVLTGHTHGGQINIPFLVNFFIPLKYDRQYRAGLYGQKNKWLYVNRGISTAVVPARINAFPEITVIRVK